MKNQVIAGNSEERAAYNALIFTNMKRTAHEVCRRLEFNGINASI